MAVARTGRGDAESLGAYPKRHREWLVSLKLDQAAHRIVLAEYLHAIEVVESSIERLEQEIAAMAESGKLAATVSGLQALRGVGMVTAATCGGNRRHHQVR